MPQPQGSTAPANKKNFSDTHTVTDYFYYLCTHNPHEDAEMVEW